MHEVVGDWRGGVRISGTNPDRPPQDIFVAGPPCQPFSKLSSARRGLDYDPFKNDPNARPSAHHLPDMHSGPAEPT